MTTTNPHPPINYTPPTLESEWQERHRAACRLPRTDNGELAILGLIGAWQNYAQLYRATYDGSSIGNDGYAGPYWLDIGRAILKLLSMDHGRRLDSGSLENVLALTCKAEGVSLYDEAS